MNTSEISIQDIIPWVAVFVSFSTLMWRLRDKYIERADKILVESWVKLILEPVCISPLRESFLNFDKEYSTVIKKENTLTFNEWNLEKLKLEKLFSDMQMSIEARFRILKIIDLKAYNLVQNEFDMIQDNLILFFADFESHKIDDNEFIVSKDTIINQIYHSLSVISKTCFQIIYNGKVKKYLQSNNEKTKAKLEYTFPYYGRILKK